MSGTWGSSPPRRSHKTPGHGPCAPVLASIWALRYRTEPSKTSGIPRQWGAPSTWIPQWVPMDSKNFHGSHELAWIPCSVEAPVWFIGGVLRWGLLHTLEKHATRVYSCSLVPNRYIDLSTYLSATHQTNQSTKSIHQPLSQIANWSNQSTNESINHSTNQPTNRSTEQQINQWINQPTHQSIKKMDQSTNKSDNQSNNQSINPYKLFRSPLAMCCV